MSNNKVGVLNTRLSVEDFVKENPQYPFNNEDLILSNGKGSWAFVFRSDEKSKIYLTAERHVPEDVIHEMLTKYGGEFYQSEYDKKPTFVYVSEKEINEASDRAYRRLRAGIKKDVAALDAQISFADNMKKGDNQSAVEHKDSFER